MNIRGSKKRIWVALAVMSLMAACHQAEHRQPITVDGNRLDSTIFPLVTIFLDRSFEFVGNDQFVLYEVADARIYLWARHADGHVSQLYWIQFESYREDNEHRYNYKNSQAINVGGASYFYDPFALKLDRDHLRTGSDTQHVLDVLDRSDLQIRSEVVGIRLVRLDPERRKELMIIYLEDLREHDFELEDVQQGGELFRRWPQISSQIRKRALAGLEILNH